MDKTLCPFSKTTWHIDNQWDVLRAAFCNSCNVFVLRGCLTFFLSWEFAWFFCPNRLLQFFLSQEVAWVFVPRGCVIFCPGRLCDFFCPKRLRDFFLSLEVSWFFCPKRLHDFFFSWEVAWFFFVLRGCVIFFFLWGFMMFLSWEVDWYFVVPRGCVIFFLSWEVAFHAWNFGDLREGLKKGKLSTFYG